MATTEDVESLLGRSRVDVRALWLLLQSGMIKRRELNRKMTELLNKIEKEYPAVYALLLPELPKLREEVLGNVPVSNYED